MEKESEDFPEIQTCHHRSCSVCLKQYFRIEIMESRVGIACPECSELFHPNDIKLIVEDDVIMQKYEDFMMRRVLAVDPDTRWCPAPDCGYAVIASGCASCPKLRCERDGCNTNFCYHCKQYWHPNQTCDAARAERSPNIRSVSVSYSQESAIQNEIKSCPRCAAFIIKMDDESCNHMTCAVCEAHFCWLCLKEVSDLHYLSPSGCTFWGRKPWSRKKKILWQLGILVGAPVGITLVAGLAVPAMIIGIPVWVGKKVHYRYELASRRKRSLAITGSVTASVFAAPVIATLAVGVGVPILLAYIYGVVPISLCRSGGCGVTTTNSGGVRFEFDEDNENNTRGAYSYTGDYHGMETGPNVANPSIAPSIGDASLGMTNSLSASGSHMDRVGVLRDDSDRDSSSHRAIAGTSINGSLCSGNYSSQHHKLEVQADISERGGLCERGSMGGESYNISLNDDASTKALAGSIISPKDKDGVSVCSRLFDGSTGNPSSAPLVYSEEGDEKDRDSTSVASGLVNASNVAAAAVLSPSVSASSSSSSSSSNAAVVVVGSQGNSSSSSCPTSPNLRKSSNAPGIASGSEESRNPRGKKCTRFMDQVPEIDDFRSDNIGSVDSIIGGGSGNVLGHPAAVLTSTASSASHQRPPTFSTMSLSSSTADAGIDPVLNSCQSLVSDEESADVGMKFGGTGQRLMGKKAESTSVLLGSAERRHDVMGDSVGCLKGDSGTSMQSAGEGTSRNRSNPHHSTSSSLRSSKNKKHRGRKTMEKKEHGSQPIHLSDISQVAECMPVHHAAGCSDLLAVMDDGSSDNNGSLNDGGTIGKPLGGGGVGSMGSRKGKSPYFHTSITLSSSSSMDDASSTNDVTSSKSGFQQKPGYLSLSASSNVHDGKSNQNVFGSSLEGVEETNELNSRASEYICSSSQQADTEIHHMSSYDDKDGEKNSNQKLSVEKLHSLSIGNLNHSLNPDSNLDFDVNSSENCSNNTLASTSLSSNYNKEIFFPEKSNLHSAFSSKRDSFSSVSVIGNDKSISESYSLPEVEVTCCNSLGQFIKKGELFKADKSADADQSKDSLSQSVKDCDVSASELRIDFKNSERRLSGSKQVSVFPPHCLAGCEKDDKREVDLQGRVILSEGDCKLKKNSTTKGCQRSKLNEDQVLSSDL